GDGIEDLIIGANDADTAGESHVVFGSSSGFSSTVELSSLDGSNGFTLNGANEDDFSGRAVSSAGDINGDEIDDLIIGAHNPIIGEDNADSNGKEEAGESYVVFGRDTSSGNASPQVETSLSNQSATTGESFSFQIPTTTFSDPNGDSLTYSASPQNGNSLPDWLSFNANNRTFSGTPTADDAGTLNLETTATDPNGATASSNFSLNVGTETISISDATFEFLAKDVAYDNQKEGERFTVEGTEYEIDRVFNDQATGFYALGLKTVNRNNSILALRGTETDKFSDILNDLHPKGIGFNQFKANWLSSKPNTDVKSWLNNQQTPDLTGHSLGGALSQWIAADYTSQTPQPNSSLGQIVTFNSPGIASNSSNVPVSATDYNPELAQSVEHYVTDGDAVSLAGDQFISGQGTLSSFIEPKPSITLGLVNRHLRPVETEQAVFGLEKPSFLFNQQSFDIENLNLVDLRSFAANAIELPGSPWGIKEPEFEIEAAKNSIRVSGGATLAIPSGVNVGGSLELSGSQLDALNLNQFTVEVSDLNKPIANTGAFLQSLSGGVENLAPSAKDVIEFLGGVGFTAGPELGNSSLLDLDLDGSVSSDRISGSGEVTLINEHLANGTGEAVLDLREDFISLDTDLELINGAIATSTSFKTDFDYNFTAMGEANVKMPDSLPMGGTELGAGNVLIEFSNDNDFSNDFIAGWGTVSNPVSFLPSQPDEIIVGLKQPFNSVPEFFGAEEVPETSSYTVAPETTSLVINANWENPTPDDVPVRVIDEEGNSIEQSDFAANNIAVVDELTNDTNKTVVIANPDPGVWDLQIVDDAGLGETEFFATRDTTSPTLDLTSPSSDVNAPNVEIGFDVANANSDTEVSLFYDTDQKGFDGIQFADGLTANNGTGSFTWDTEGVPPGEYFIYGTVTDGVTPPDSSYSQGQVLVTEETDLAVTQTASSNQVVVGNEFTYTVTVTNNGTATSQGIELVETLAEEATLVSSSLAPSEQDNNTLTFDLSSLGEGESETVELTVAAPTAATGTITSRASVNSDTFDPDATNDAADFTTSVISEESENSDNNSIPVAKDNSGANFTTDEDTILITGNVLANDSDANPGDNLIISAVEGNNFNLGESITLASGAEVTLNGDGTFDYNPNSQFEDLNEGDTATDSFTYTVSDGNVTDTATVDITVNGVTDNQAPEITTPNAVEVEENLTSVTTIAVQDPEEDAINFALAGGADRDLFAIDANTGELTFNEAPDFDNPEDADGDNSYELQVEASDDNGGITTQNLQVTVTDDGIPQQPTFDSIGGNQFDINSGDNNEQSSPATLVQSLQSSAESDIAEVGLIDPTVRENEGLEQALAQGTTLFSALPAVLPNGEDGISQDIASTLQRTIETKNDEIEYYFLEGEGVSSDAIINGEASPENVSLEAFDISSTQENNSFNFNDPNGEFTFATNLNQGATVPTGAGLQGQSNGEVIDLRGSGEVTASLGLGGVRSVAGFDNIVGLYAVDNPSGEVDGLAPGAEGYTEAALANAVDNFILKGGSNTEETSADFSVDLAGDQILAPFLIAQGGSLDQIPSDLEGEQEAYFPYLDANSDGADHFRLLADNTFGMEDLEGGGDQDFNDIIFQAEFA
ncbi:MAG: hypothetical protein BRC48_16900, partial [Cyanobacteria bacterium QS_9_48_30]